MGMLGRLGNIRAWVREPQVCTPLPELNIPWLRAGAPPVRCKAGVIMPACITPPSMAQITECAACAARVLGLWGGNAVQRGPGWPRVAGLLPSGLWSRAGF